jgi:hypothetical protein
LEFEARFGERYVLEASTDLRDWVAVAAVKERSGRTVLEQPLRVDLPQTFYRIVLAPQ